MSATTLSYFGPSFEDTGDIWGTLAGLFGGGGAPNPAGNPAGGMGSTLGGLGGATLATSLGMPQLAGVASNLGGMLGGLAGQGIGSLVQKPPPKKRPPQASANQRRILEQGKALAQRTGNPGFVQDAELRVSRPAEYKRRRELGRLPSQLVQRQQAAAGKPPAPRPPNPAPATAPAPAAPAPAAPPAAQPSPNFAALFEGLTGPERARLELAIQEGRGAETWKEIQALRVAQASPSPAPFEQFDEPPVVEMDGYSETSGPPEVRPQPKKHLAILPLQQGQLEGLLRAVPALQKLDKRLLRLLAGRSSVARDVSGVDPSRGVYHATPGETAYGVAKKLTGDPNRVAELVAANPGNAGPAWQIPPGWLAYDADTGAITTARRYTVLQNDTPYGIAKKLGALAIRPKWWSELKAASPDKPTKDNGGNWETLFAGEVIGIPDVWPSASLPNLNGIPPAPPNPPVGPFPPSGPGLPSPGQTNTQDPGVFLQAQALLALWAKQNPAACVPADFGSNPTDFTGTATPRCSMAIASFQAWWNKARPSSALRTDGVLDEPTYRALFTATAAQMPAPSPEQPKPAPAPVPTFPGGLQFPQLPQLPQLPPWLAGALGGAVPNAPAPSPQQPSPAPQAPQVPPWLSGWFGGGISASPPLPQFPTMPTTSTAPGLPPWMLPQSPAPAPAPKPQPQPAADEGPALPLMTMLGAGLFLS